MGWKRPSVVLSALLLSLVALCKQVTNLLFQPARRSGIYSLSWEQPFVSMESVATKLYVTSAAIISGTYVANTGLTGSFVTTVHAPTAIASLAVDLHIFCRVRYSSLSGAPFFAIHLPVFRLRPFTDTQYHRTSLVTSYPIEIWPYRLRSRGFLVIWTSCIVAVILHTSLIPLPLMVSGGNTT